MRKRTKQKIKKRKIKKDASPKQVERKIRWKCLCLAVIPFLAQEGLQLMGYTNPILGWTLLCLCGLLGWLFIYTSDWPNLPFIKVLNKLKKRYVIVIGYIVILVLFAILALCAPGKEETDILAKLNKMLVDAQQEEERLNKEYPLGYVMIAFSGEKKVIIPSSGRVVVENPHNMIVYIDNNYWIHIDNCNIYDNQSHSRATDCSFGTLAKPGQKAVVMTWKSPKKDLQIVVECVKTEPIGVCAVLGFSEKN